MARYDDYDEGQYYDGPYDDEDDDDGYEEEEEDEFVLDDEDDDDVSAYTTGEQDVDISREIDPDGNEVWFAKDSSLPGASSSMGHSLEEALDGVEERRREFREMLRRSREQRDRDADEEE